MQWYLFTSDIDRYSRFHHISSLQLQAPSEFGIVFWALLTPSQNVFGALLSSWKLPCRADVAPCAPRHHGGCLCTAEDVHESFRRRRRLAGRSRGAAVQKILDGMATIWIKSHRKAAPVPSPFLKPSKCSMNPRIPLMFGIVSSLALLHYQQPH